jgi:phage terminase large subunit
MFPRTDAVSFIAMDDVLDAQSRNPEGQEPLPIIGGLDVARLGPDHSVLCPRQGRDAKSRPWPRVHGLNTVQLAKWAFEHYLRLNLSALVVDVGGVGGGVYDQLELMEINVYPVDFSSKPDNDTAENYLNKRAEMAGRTRSWIKKGGCLPVDANNSEGKGLSYQLAASTYTYQADVHIQLESKKDIRRRLGLSPDDADALFITFAYPYLEEAFVPPCPGEEDERASYSEANPYADVSSAKFNPLQVSR